MLSLLCFRVLYCFSLSARAGELRKFFSTHTGAGGDAPIVSTSGKRAGGVGAAATVMTAAPTQPYGLDAIQKLVKSLTKQQLLEILTEMKKFTQQNPEGARQLLIDSPQVAQTLLQIQILFSLVRPEDLQSINTSIPPAQQGAGPQPPMPAAPAQPLMTQPVPPAVVHHPPPPQPQPLHRKSIARYPCC